MDSFSKIQTLRQSIWSVVLCLIFFPIDVAAQSPSYEIGGYSEYLFSSTLDSPEGNTVDHLLHARLNTKWFPTDDLTGVLELRFRGYFGETVERTPDFADEIKNRNVYSNVDATLWASKSSLGYGEVDRGYATWSPDNWQFTVGRQRIAWGTNLVWNVIDIFNPLSVLDFDYEERPSVDAVRVQYYTGPVTSISAAYKPTTTYSKSIGAVLWTLHHWNYDFHFLGGQRYGLNFGGLGWAGDIGGGGFRGEGLVSQVPDALGNPTSQAMVSAALSGDYTFPNSFYIHTEILYNSMGVTKDAALFRLRAEQLSLLSPARWSVYQEFSYNISPLVRGSVFALINPDDGSIAFVPSVTWSAVTDLDLMALGLIFSGPTESEFGGTGKGIYVRGRWSF
jgi:hypothetical protein